jgi:hypothetical protein
MTGSSSPSPAVIAQGREKATPAAFPARRRFPSKTLYRFFHTAAWGLAARY